MFMKLKIREVRKKRNLTQIELAKLTGISKSSISRYEREEIWPDMLEMEWIALALDVKITDLFDSKVK
ncbi:XRE family transcriptional regulator [Thomasclavelia ramosa]|nr:XRE family transcriptional regulator [Thomasclavelia ramosa]RGQ46294.1 XRE family transcriptional regulator [Thomasclavelia ramosa]